MASHIYFKSSGLFLVIFTIVVQSIPIEKSDNIVQSPLIANKPAVNQHVQKFIDLVKSTTISTTTITTKPTETVSQNSLSPSTTKEEKTDNKKKRFIEDDYNMYFDNDSDELNSFDLPYFKYDNVDDSFDHKLHTKVHETEAKIHDNTDKKPVTDDSTVFSDIKMSPSELTTIVRRRRSVKLNDALNSRRKRALSPYDFYDSNSLYDPYTDTLDYDRYARSFAPLYWYPSAYKRHVRSSVSSNYPIIYSPLNNNDIDENPLPMYDDENNDDEINRYPILVEVPSDPIDNFQIQEAYNRDDLPIGGSIEEILNENDDDDDDEDDEDDDEIVYPSIYPRQRPYHARYEPLETYF